MLSCLKLFTSVLGDYFRKWSLIICKTKHPHHRKRTSYTKAYVLKMKTLGHLTESQVIPDHFEENGISYHPLNSVDNITHLTQTVPRTAARTFLSRLSGKWKLLPDKFVEFLYSHCIPRINRSSQSHFTDVGSSHN